MCVRVHVCVHVCVCVCVCARVCVCVCVRVSHSFLSDSATPWTVAHRGPVSLAFSRQEYSSELLFPSAGDLLRPRDGPRSPAWWADPLPSEPPGEPFTPHTSSLTVFPVLLIPAHQCSLLLIALGLFCSPIYKFLLWGSRGGDARAYSRRLSPPGGRAGRGAWRESSSWGLLLQVSACRGLRSHPEPCVQRPETG